MQIQAGLVEDAPEEHLEDDNAIHNPLALLMSGSKISSRLHRGRGHGELDDESEKCHVRQWQLHTHIPGAVQGHRQSRR